MDKSAIWKLHPVIKNYNWGSYSAFKTHFNIANPKNLPQAELWMGTHPNGTATVEIQQDTYLLSDLITTNQAGIRSPLPYLLKVIAAEKALSIQVHPDKYHAQRGFCHENTLGIANTAPERHFHDPNHKPELVYALTPFLALKGFRSIDIIIALFEAVRCAIFDAQIANLRQTPTSANLKQFFSSLFKLSQEEKHQAIEKLSQYSLDHHNDLTVILSQLLMQYPDDIGVFAPLLLNPIQLAPGQAIYIAPGTLHTYLHGVAVEVMASSDNVIRAGLTPKHVDIPTLLAVTHFDSIQPETFYCQPIIHGDTTTYPLPVDDFHFEVIQSDRQPRIKTVDSDEILFCFAGHTIIQTPSQQIQLQAGESIFIPTAIKQFSYYGNAQLARVYSPNHQ